MFQEFIANLKALWTHYSTWFSMAASGAAFYWLSVMSEMDRNQVLSAFPELPWLGPLLAFVAFVILKGIPQPPKPPKE